MIETGGEVAWLAMHKAYIRFGHAREAAAALVQAIPVEPGADCTRQVRQRVTTMKMTRSWFRLCLDEIHACNGVPCTCEQFYTMCAFEREQAATAMNAVVEILGAVGQHNSKEGRRNVSPSIIRKQWRLRKRARAYLHELAQSVRLVAHYPQMIVGIIEKMVAFIVVLLYRRMQRPRCYLLHTSTL